MASRALASKFVSQMTDSHNLKIPLRLNLPVVTKIDKRSQVCCTASVECCFSIVTIVSVRCLEFSLEVFRCGNELYK